MIDKKPSVYLDTSIFSYLVDDRQDIGQDIKRTCEWWEKERSEYQAITSTFVIDELLDGDFPNRDKAISFSKSVKELSVIDEVKIIAETYVREFVMPKGSEGDAAHLAMASFYRLDYLLTWNCKHLANIKKKRHIEVINNKLGLFVPELITPNMLRLEED